LDLESQHPFPRDVVSRHVKVSFRLTFADEDESTALETVAIRLMSDLRPPHDSDE
jgi:hypothetical protein